MKKNIWMWILALIPLVVTIAVLPLLPEQVPMHYNASGEIDRWGSRNEQLIFPVMILAITGFWQLLTNHYQKKGEKLGEKKEGVEALNSAKFLRLVSCGEAILFGIMHLTLLYTSHVEANLQMESNLIDFPKVCNILMGIFIIVLGNYMPKLGKNSTAGFRTAASMKNDEVWKKSNRFAGKALMVSGVAIVVLSLLVSGMVGMILMLVILLAMAIVCQAYAMRL